MAAPLKLCNENSTHLLSLGFHGSEIWIRVGWVLHKVAVKVPTRSVVSSQCLIKERAVFKFRSGRQEAGPSGGTGLRASVSCPLLTHGYSQFLGGFWLEPILRSLPWWPPAHGLSLPLTPPGAPGGTVCNIMSHLLRNSVLSSLPCYFCGSKP